MNRRDVAMNPDLRTVLSTITLLNEETLARLIEAAVKFGVVWPVVRARNIFYPHFQQFSPGVAGDIAISLIDQREPSCRIAFGYARHHLLRQSSSGPLLAFTQRLHSPRLIEG